MLRHVSQRTLIVIIPARVTLLDSISTILESIRLNPGWPTMTLLTSRKMGAKIVELEQLVLE